LNYFEVCEVMRSPAFGPPKEKCPSRGHSQRCNLTSNLEGSVEVESAPAAISLVWSHVLGRGSLPLRPELPHLYIAYMRVLPAGVTFHFTVSNAALCLRD
jgi:hypothetical protein